MKFVDSLKMMQEEEFKKAKMKDMEEKKRSSEAEKLKKQEEEKTAKAVQEAILSQQKHEEEKKMKQAAVPPEPEANNPAVCEIAFRLPSGRRMARRFLKSTAISGLYDYVASLGEADIDGVKYEISQPIPKKVYSNMNATLEEEGLVTRAVLQVAAIE